MAKTEEKAETSVEVVQAEAEVVHQHPWIADLGAHVKEFGRSSLPEATQRALALADRNRNREKVKK